MVRTAHRDPVFDEVARRELEAQRRAERMAKRAANDAAWRASPDYRRIRRARILRLMRLVMSGRR